MKLATQEALAGQKFTQENGVDKVDKSLVANFEIINLVPDELLNKEFNSINNNFHIHLDLNTNGKY